jgi:hypothetical protein
MSTADRSRVAPRANGAQPVASRSVTWAVWLAIPVVLTALAAVFAWLRNRPPRPVDTARAMREHGEYLDALVRTARSKDRGIGAASAD